MSEENRLDQATTEYASLYQEHPKDLTVKKYYVQLLILKDRIDEAAKLNEEVLKVVLLMVLNGTQRADSGVELIHHEVADALEIVRLRVGGGQLVA